MGRFASRYDTSSRRADSGGGLGYGGGRASLGELADCGGGDRIQQVRSKRLKGTEPEALEQPLRPHHLIC